MHHRVLNMPKFKCNWCTFTSNHKSSYKRHLLYKHDRLLEEEKECDICDMKFMKAIEYQQHRKSGASCALVQRYVPHFAVVRRSPPYCAVLCRHRAV